MIKTLRWFVFSLSCVASLSQAATVNPSPTAAANALAARLAATNSGQGADLIANATGAVATVAALKALPVPSTVSGRAWTRGTQGYYAAGDGGANVYHWVAASTANADDGAVIACTANGANPGRWLAAGGMISAAQYGAFDPITQAARFTAWYAYIDAGTAQGNDQNGQFFGQFHAARNTYGTFDTAAAASVQANQGRRPKTQVLGFTIPSDVSTYPDRDSVALFVDNQAPTPTLTITAGSATFTATTITAAGISPTVVLPGMLIDTAPDPAISSNKWTGTVTAVVGTTATVSNWYRVDGSRVAGTPPNTLAAYVNPRTKVWAVNANLLVPSTAQATSGTGFELGLKADKSISGFGFDAVNLGSVVWGTAYSSRGLTPGFAIGYSSTDHTTIGFSASSPKSGAFNFSSQGTSASNGYVDIGSAISYDSRGAVGAAFRATNGAGSITYAQINNLGQAGPWRLNPIVVSGTASINAGNTLVIATGTAPYTLTLPTPVGFAGLEIRVANKTAGTVTIASAAGLVETGTYALLTSVGKTFYSDGTNWIRFE